MAITGREGGAKILNVLLVVPWDDVRGGVISVVANLATHLRAAGHCVLFFHSAGTFLKNKVTKLGFAGVQLRLMLPFGPGRWRRAVRTTAFPILFVATLVQLAWLLRVRRIDIVNLHYPHDNYVYFAICRRFLPIRLVTSIHGGDAFYAERPKDAYSWAFTFVLRSSDLIVLPSDTYRRKLLEAFPDLHDRIVFIHNGINPADFCPEGSVSPYQHYILCVADLQRYKGIDVLLRAAKPVLENEPSLTLIIAGDGPLRAALEELAVSLGIRQRTRFLGRQSAAEVASLMRGCEMLVLPSRMESFGIVLIEAMACRAPVVASNVGGIPEIVEHEVTGVLTEPESPSALTAAMRRVLTDPTLRTTIKENGYARVMQRFCATHNGTAYVDAFESVLQGRPPASWTSSVPVGRGRGADASL
jgi:glycosyltransferase involved in cell wall biosynthesis